MARLRTFRIPLGTQIVDSEILPKSVSLGRDVTIRGSKVAAGVTLGPESRMIDSTCLTGTSLGRSSHLVASTLADFARLHDSSEAHNSSIGKASYIAERTLVYGANIGKFTSIGPECLVCLPEHPVSWLTTSPHFYGDQERSSPYNDASLSFAENGTVKIGSDVWLGARVIVRQGVTIGHGAIVAAGAVVVKDVEPYTLVGGVPAKLIRRRLSESDTARMLSLSWWDWPDEVLPEIGPLLAASDIRGLENMKVERSL